MLNFIHLGWNSIVINTGGKIILILYLFYMFLASIHTEVFKCNVICGNDDKFVSINRGFNLMRDSLWIVRDRKAYTKLLHDFL